LGNATTNVHTASGASTNSGTINGSLTNTSTTANSSSITGSLTTAGGSNSGTITGSLTNTGGSFSNNSGGIITGTTTIDGGTVVADGVTFDLTLNDGTLNNAGATGDVAVTVLGPNGTTAANGDGTFSIGNNGSVLASGAGDLTVNAQTIEIGENVTVGANVNLSGNSTNNGDQDIDTNLGGSLTVGATGDTDIVADVDANGNDITIGTSVGSGAGNGEFTVEARNALTNVRSFDNNGLLTIEAGTAADPTMLVIDNTSAGNSNDPGSFSNNGETSIGENATLSARSLTNESGTITVGGTLQGTGNTMNNDALTVVAAGGTVTDAGAINNNSGGTFQFLGAGTINADDDNTGGEALNNVGAITTAGASVTVGDGTADILNNGTNIGAFFNNGPLASSATVATNAGTMGAVTNQLNSTFTATGSSVQTNVFNAGTATLEGGTAVNVTQGIGATGDLTIGPDIDGHSGCGEHRGQRHHHNQWGHRRGAG